MERKHKMSNYKSDEEPQHVKDLIQQFEPEGHNTRLEVETENPQHTHKLEEKKKGRGMKESLLTLSNHDEDRQIQSDHSGGENTQTSDQNKQDEVETKNPQICTNTIEKTNEGNSKVNVNDFQSNESKIDSANDNENLTENSGDSDSIFFMNIIPERPDANKNPKNLGNWYYHENGFSRDKYLEKDIQISPRERENREMFNKDFLTNIDFYNLWCVGWKSDQFKQFYDDQLFHYRNIDILALKTLLKSDVGFGTDPERKEYDLLNVKAPVLCRSLFSTLSYESDVHMPFRNIHTLLQEKQVSKTNKLSFGVGVNFPEISLGFTTVDEIGEVMRNLNIIGVTDEGIRCATTSSSLKRDRLSKHLDVNCRIAITRMIRELTILSRKSDLGKDVNSIREIESIRKPFENPLLQLPLQLNEFMQKYGTHVVLKCSHGYRMLHIKRTTVNSSKSYHEFKRKLDTNLQNLQTTFEKAKMKKNEVNNNEHFVKVLYIGSPASLKQAFSTERRHIMEDNMARNDESKVISHDETIMLADILEQGKTILPRHKFISWELLSNIYRYWTNIRIQDLQQGQCQ